MISQRLPRRRNLIDQSARLLLSNIFASRKAKLFLFFSFHFIFHRLPFFLAGYYFSTFFPSHFFEPLGMWTTVIGDATMSGALYFAS